MDQREIQARKDTISPAWSPACAGRSAETRSCSPLRERVDQWPAFDRRPLAGDDDFVAFALQPAYAGGVGRSAGGDENVLTMPLDRLGNREVEAAARDADRGLRCQAVRLAPRCEILVALDRADLQQIVRRPCAMARMYPPCVMRQSACRATRAGGGNRCRSSAPREGGSPRCGRRAVRSARSSSETKLPYTKGRSGRPSSV